MHHRRVRWAMAGGIENPEARRVLDWIRRHDAEAFTRKELTDHLRWLNQRAGGADVVLSWMEERHLIRRASPDREEGRSGRPPSPTYEVNPACLDPENVRPKANGVGSANSAKCAAQKIGGTRIEKQAHLLLDRLRQVPGGMTRTRIREEVYQRNKPSEEIAALLTWLETNGLARSETVPTEGRHATLWIATTPADEGVQTWTV